MRIVSARDFRANQGKYFSMVNSGEHVILKSVKAVSVWFRLRLLTLFLGVPRILQRI